MNWEINLETIIHMNEYGPYKQFVGYAIDIQVS